MPTIVDVPGMGEVEFPDGMSDDQIASAIKANMQPEMATVPPLPGTPQYDEFTRNRTPPRSVFSGFADYLSNVGKAYSVADKQRQPGPFGLDTGALQAMGSLASGAIAMPIGSIAGMGTEALRGLGLTDARGEDVGERVQNALTYKPSSPGGKAQLDLVGAVTAPVTESGADIALMPLAAEASALRPSRVPKEKAPPIPTTEELRKAKNVAYKAGNASDVLTTPQQNATAVGRINEALRNENLVVDPDLHPKSTALLRRLNDQQGKPLSVPEAESLRQLALEVERDIDPVTKQPTADAYRAGVILDELDNSLETLSVNKPARELNARFRRSQMVDEMIRRAEIKAGAHYTQAGMEHALRQEFKQLALNPRRMRGLTMEQKAAIEKVAKGGPLENSMRVLGKFDPTAGGMASLVSLGTSGLASSVAGPAALALPPAGFAGRRIATALTAKNVAKAREALVGRGPIQQPAVQPGLLGAEPASTGLLGGSIRSADLVRRDLQALDEKIRNLPPGEPAGSPRIKALVAEWERLRAELSRAESAGGSP